MSAYMLMWAAVAVLGQNGPVISLQSGDLQIALLSEAERSSAIAAAAGMGPSELDEMLRLGIGDVEGVLVPLYGAVGKATIHLKRPQ